MLFYTLIWKGSKANTLFDDVELTVEMYERIAIIGPNGSSKSILLFILMFRHIPSPQRLSWLLLFRPIEDRIFVFDCSRRVDIPSQCYAYMHVPPPIQFWISGGGCNPYLNKLLRRIHNELPKTFITWKVDWYLLFNICSFWINAGNIFRDVISFIPVKWIHIPIDYTWKSLPKIQRTAI